MRLRRTPERLAQLEEFAKHINTHHTYPDPNSKVGKQLGDTKFPHSVTAVVDTGACVLLSGAVSAHHGRCRRPLTPRRCREGAARRRVCGVCGACASHLL